MLELSQALNGIIRNKISYIIKLNEVDLSKILEVKISKIRDIGNRQRNLLSR